MSQPVKPRLFVWSDLLFIGVTLFALVGATGGTLTTGNELAGILIAWATAFGCLGITAIMYFKRKRQLDCLRYWSCGMVVAWEGDAYAVSDADFERQVSEFMFRVQGLFPQAQRALNGCVVFFTSPTFVQWSPSWGVRRMVAGLQDGPVIVVGWQLDLKDSALQHELFHRCAQVFLGDPTEEIAHRMMKQVGLG